MFGLLLLITLASDPTDDSAVAPKLELSEILSNWERASADAKTTRLEITCIVYNLTFQEERVSSGELLLQSPGKVSVNLQPQKSIDSKEARPGRNGAFRVVPGMAVRKIWADDKLVRIDDLEKTFEIVDKRISSESDEPFTAPKTFWERFAWAIALAHCYADFPFLLEIHTDRIQKQWDLKLTRQSTDSVILSAKPKSELLKELHSECLVKIDTQTWQTTAVKYIGEERSYETVLKVNAREQNVRLPPEAFEPDLKGYKQLVLD